MQLTHIRDLTVAAPLASGHRFLSAASGLVRMGDLLCVVADDAHCLALFALGDAAPGRLIPLIPGDLPRDAAARKRVKPDFEILLALPGGAAAGAGTSSGAAGHRLLAMGSGSTARRMRGAIIDLADVAGAAGGGAGGEGGSGAGGEGGVRLIDLTPLFAALAPLVPHINLEGAVLDDDRLLLFNRGTMTNPASQILAVSLAAVLAGGPVAATLCAELRLPMCDGVPLTVTDACRIDRGGPHGGHILLSAVAEATADSTADGALRGAAIVELDAAFNVLGVEPLEPLVKVEGLAAWVAADGVHILCVTDADDPARVAGVYGGVQRR